MKTVLSSNELVGLLEYLNERVSRYGELDNDFFLLTKRELEFIDQELPCLYNRMLCSSTSKQKLYNGSIAFSVDVKQFKYIIGELIRFLELYIANEKYNTLEKYIP